MSRRQGFRVHWTLMERSVTTDVIVCVWPSKFMGETQARDQAVFVATARVLERVPEALGIGFSVHVSKIELEEVDPAVRCIAGYDLVF